MPLRAVDILLFLVIAPSVVANASPTQKKADRAASDVKACESGDGRACSSLGERYEAGLLDDIHDMAGIMREAAKYYRKSCEIYKRPSCPNAERVEEKVRKIEQLKAAKGTPAEKELKIKQCEEALDRAKREDPKYAFSLVSSRCKVLYSGGCAKSWDAVVGTSGDMRARLLAYGCGEEYCPKLQGETFQACKGKLPANLTKDQAGPALKSLHSRVLSLELSPESAQSLRAKFDAVWSALFP